MKAGSLCSAEAYEAILACRSSRSKSLAPAYFPSVFWNIANISLSFALMDKYRYVPLNSKKKEKKLVSPGINKNFERINDNNTKAAVDSNNAANRRAVIFRLSLI